LAKFWGHENALSIKRQDREALMGATGRTLSVLKTLVVGIAKHPRLYAPVASPAVPDCRHLLSVGVIGHCGPPRHNRVIISGVNTRPEAMPKFNFIVNLKSIAKFPQWETVSQTARIILKLARLIR
jgi:hypothetical protein